MLFVFKYKSLPIGLNIAGFQDLIPDFATLSKKSVGLNSPADYEGKRCSAVRYSTGKLGKGGVVGRRFTLFAFGEYGFLYQ